MITLAIDTSTDRGGVALLEGDELIDEISLNAGLQHSLAVLPAISALLGTAGMAVGDIDLLACAIGPGSFTGLRVGAATLKGLALATGCPIAGVSTLEALAANIADSRADVCPMLDALNGMVYTALYRTGDTGLPQRIFPETMAAVGDVLAGLKRDTVFLGSGARKYADLIAAKLPVCGQLAPERHQQVRAAVVGRLGLHQYRLGNCMDSGTLTPRYLQQPYAEQKHAARGADLRRGSGADGEQCPTGRADKKY